MNILRLWLLEFKKMFFQWKFILLILIFLIVNGFKIVLSNELEPRAIESRNLYSNAGYSETEKTVSGEITLEKAQKIVNGYNAHTAFLQGNGKYSQENLNYYIMYPNFVYQYEYHTKMTEKFEIANENIEFFDKRKNTYLKEKNELFLKCYKNRFIADYYNSSDFNILFEYDFSTFLLLILTLIYSMQLFFSERQSGMLTILKSNRKGKKLLPFIKITSFAVIILIISALFYVEDILIHGAMFHLNGWSNPIYAINEYQFCIYNGSIAGYYILICLIRIAVLFIMGLIFSLVAQLIKGKIFPQVINLIIISVCIMLSEQSEEFSFISMLNPINLLEFDKIAKQFNVINFFDMPISSFQFLSIIIILCLIILLLLNYMIYRIPMQRRRKQ